MSERAMQRARVRELEMGRRRKARRMKRIAAGAGTLLGASALLAPTANAANFPVTSLADSGSGTLREAVGLANANPDPDVISFQSGLGGQIDVASPITIQAALDIQGPGADQITIDGGDNNGIFSVNPAVIGAAGDPVSISGLTLANGLAAEDGGAINAADTALTLDSVVVRDSYAPGGPKYGGGGVSIGGDTSSLTVAGSQITDNASGKYGGGIATSDVGGTVLITGSTISGNSAAGYGGGAAFYDQRGDISVEKSTVSGNDGGTGSGGGIWFEDTYDGSSTSVVDSTVTNNTTDAAGGGISFGENFSGPTRVVNSTVTGNSAARGGGIQFNDLDDAGYFELTDSTVTGNQATDVGGGVFRGYDYEGDASDSSLSISSSAIAGNTAVNGGPGIGQNGAATGTLYLGNSLLQDPADAAYTEDPTGSNIVGQAPGLGALADNGGPTQTRLPDPTSPLVDAGLANGLSNDQRGLARTVDYPGVPATHGSDGTDIGAAELAAPAPAPPPAADTEVTDPVVKAKKHQREGRRNIKVKLRAGAGEDVEVRAYGRIHAKKGFPVKKVSTTASSGNLTKIVLKPRRRKNERKIERSLANGKKVRATIKVLLKDAAGNTDLEKLRIKLKPRHKARVR